MEKKEKTTPVTEENYSLAETQMIFADYIQKIRAATNSKTGTGIFMHKRDAMSPNDRTIMRPNFDTLYSFAVMDLNSTTGNGPTTTTLVMPSSPTGRYQTAICITEDHYLPLIFDKPGTYTITREELGTPYGMIVVRTQVNMKDTTDMSAAHAMQDQLKLQSSEVGEYVPSNHWDMDEILAMRSHFHKLVKDRGISANDMFGRKDQISFLNHNCGTAQGWGGLPKEQAVYPQIFPSDASGATAYTLTLENVPCAAFWSVTVYDADGYVSTAEGAVYNINSAFAVADEGGEKGSSPVTIYFGGKDQEGGEKKKKKNRMDIMPGWNIALRLYQPTEAYFSGTWSVPTLKPC